MNRIGNAYIISAQVNNRELYLLKSINIFEEILNSTNLKNHPMDYSNIQSNLGNAYYQISTMINSEGNLLRAIDCFKEAVQVETTTAIYPFEEERPAEYAKIEYNLGKVYTSLSKIKDNEKNLFYAIESLKNALWGYSEALKIKRIERFPLDYAEINSSIGRTYISLSKINYGEDNYLKAMNAFEQALRVYHKEKCTLDYNQLKEYIGSLA